MAIRKILQLGDPLLRMQCMSVDDPTHPDIVSLVQDLADTVRDVRGRTGYGRAIAAPQIGSLFRVIYLDVPTPLPMINPRIVKRSAEQVEVWDGCLSFLSIFMKVWRAKEIIVSYQDLSGTTHEVTTGEADDLAELLQHEIDHLDGVLCLDRLSDIRSICTREEFEARFCNSSPYAKHPAIPPLTA